MCFMDRALRGGGAPSGGLPAAAQRLIVSSADLYSRVKRLDDGTMFEEPAQSPARALMGQLERGLGNHTLN